MSGLNTGMDRSEATLALAALFHDPPWKPWSITRVFRPGAHTLAERVCSTAGARGECGLTRIAEEALGADVYRGGHEVQASIIPLAIAWRLDGSEGVLAEIASVFVEAARMIASNNRSVWEADVEASAIDRATLWDLLREEGIEREVYSKKVRLVNPFMPAYKLEAPGVISEELVSKFIEGYSDLVADAIKSLCGQAATPARCYSLALVASYLLMEPAWYKFTRSTVDGEVYVPPADTRIPTHTVFDHIDSVLTVMLLRQDGCLAILDLAGVQAWIRESRRLRDLWASSWLASYLAWRAVEPLVWRHGPGVLVSPPGRLNPLLASRFLGAWIEKRSARDKWLWSALGLNPAKRWPVDPVIPSRLLIAVPGSDCQALEDTIRKAVEDAWSLILRKALDTARKACEDNGLTLDECPLLDNETYELASRIEAPLGVRVVSIPWRNVGGDSLTRYARALIALNRKAEEIIVKAPGRRIGPNYLRLAKKLYAATKKTQHLHCTICGKGYSIIRLSEASRPLRGVLLREVGGENLCPYCLVKRLLRHLIISQPTSFARPLTGLIPPGEDELRWSSVWNHSSRIKYLEGLIEAGQLDSLIGELASILAMVGCSDALKQLLAILRGLARETGSTPPLLWGVPSALRQSVRRACGGGAGEPLDRLIWTIIVEMMSLPPDKLSRVLESAERETLPASGLGEWLSRILKAVTGPGSPLKNAPRRYAIIVADADYMGKGLLQGKIPGLRLPASSRSLEPASPGEYFAEGVVLTPPERLEAKVRRVYSALRGKVESAVNEIFQEIKASCGECGEQDIVECNPPTLPVTPAYHATLSRSLAVVSVIDREHAEDHGGEVVYLGGDDALIIAPPASLQAGERGASAIKVPALEIAASLRSTWAGFLEETHTFPAGFLAIVDDGSILHIAPAPGAYGRSVAVFLADAKYPMWLSLATAHELEEAKDHAALERPGEGMLWRKDILALGSDARGAVLLPQIVPGYTANPKRWLKAVEKLYKLITTCALSKRSLHGLPVETGALAARLLALGESQYVADIIASTLSRWIRKKRLLEELRNEPACSVLINTSGPRGIPPKKLAACVIASAAGLLKAAATGRLDPLEAVRNASSLAAVVKRGVLVIHGVDYASNPYLNALQSGEYALIPLPYAPFAAAYIYESGVSLPRSCEGSGEGV